MNDILNWKTTILLLRTIAEEKGITQKDIAEATGLKQPAVSRFFTLKECPKYTTILKVSAALGVVLIVKDVTKHNVKNENNVNL